MRRVLFLSMMLILASLPAAATAESSDQLRAERTDSGHCEYHVQTGNYLCFGFRAYWHQFGGLETFGYPITNEFAEDGKTVQYFQRARFEWHPGVWPERHDVLLGLLGVELIKDRLGIGPFAPVGEAKDGCVQFDITGHNVCGEFLKRWNMAGGLPVFGYPVSEAFVEDGMLVQYFQRQRMEHQPGVRPSRDDVLLGLLGVEVMANKGHVEDETIKIGVRTALTGPVSRQGQEVLNSVQLAVDEWNAQGGILGKRIEVVAADDASSPEQGVAVSHNLCADDGVVGVVGSFQSAVGIPSTAVLAECNLAYVAPGETNPLLTDRGLPNVNRMSPRDDDQGPALAIYAREFMGVDKAFVLDDQSAGGQGLAEAFVAKSAELGIETERAVITVGDTDFRDILSAVPGDVDALVFYGFLPEGALIAQQWREIGRTEPILGGDPLYEQEGFIDASEGAAEGAAVTFIGPDIRTVPEAAGYLEAYEERYGPVLSYGPQAYEAANIILSAIERAGSTDRVEVRDAVRQTAGYQGILGITITFDEKGDIEGGTIFVFRVVDGAFVQDQMIVTR